MSNRKVTVIAVVCLVVGIFAGVAGAQILQGRIVNSPLASVRENETLNFHLTLEDQGGAPPAYVAMQVFDEDGAVVARKEGTLPAGHSMSLQKKGPGLFRVNAQMLEVVPQLTARRTAMGSAEISNDFTAEIRPVCSFDQVGVGGGRN